MKNKTFRILSILWLVAFIVGFIALIARFATGEKLVGYGSYVGWGLWVALYFHFVGIAGGVFAVGAAGYLFKIKGFQEHLRTILIVSAAAVIAGLFAIWLDLGQPFRAARIMYAPNFGSMMAFNAWMYNLFLVVAAVVFYLSFKKSRSSDLNDKSGWLVPLLALGGLMSIAFPSQSGAFFGVVDAKPFWSSALLPILFLTSAIVAGAATLLLVFTFLFEEDDPVHHHPFKYLRLVTIIGVVFYFVAEFAEYSLVFWSPISHSREAVELVMFGPFWWVFWFVHLGGAIVALLLLVRGRSMPVIGTGAFLVAVTFVSARLNVLIPGQSVTELEGLRNAFSHYRLNFTYVATPTEYLVALFIGAFGVALAYLGIRWVAVYSARKEGSLI